MVNKELVVSNPSGDVYLVPLSLTVPTQRKLLEETLKVLPAEGTYKPGNFSFRAVRKSLQQYQRACRGAC
jgi:hypothetical protein